MTDQNDSSIEEVIRLLEKQNKILEYINILIVYSLEKENDKHYMLRSRITDIDISIGAMIGLSFKWLFASIPVGIVLFFIFFFLINMGF